jgi:uncharacterized repeat protein (TIGR01451 family)
MKTNLKHIISTLGCVALLAGCAQQQQQHKYAAAPANEPATTEAAPAPKPGTVTAYFPSGKAEGSGLSVQKTAPAEVIAGQPFAYTYEVKNLTAGALENVQVVDRVTPNFTPADSEPNATSAKNGQATWNLGTLAAGETKTITVKGSSADEGVVTTCGWASYTPVICQDIHVTKANIALTKSEPAEVLICDSIPATITVKNTGSSPLTGVQIADSLPAGLTSDGKSDLTFDIGNLAPGESKEVKYVAAASSTGKFENKAKVTCAQGVTAEASATTTVHQPVLAITCKAAEQQFMGRKFQVCYTVSNTGDAPAAGTKLEVAVPAGLEIVSAGSGQVTPGKITYDLGTVGTDAPQNVCATFTSATAGTFDFAGTAKGTCAAAVSTDCSTKIVGVAAILLEKADNPDPVAVGDTTTYTVKVTNQGTADDHNIQIIVNIAPELTPVSSSEGIISGQKVTMPKVAALAPKQAVTYQIVAKGVKAGDGHTVFQLSSDVLSTPITAEESTHVY